MFLSGLHLDSTEEDLREFFQEFGEIVDCVVMRDGHTKKSRGFGFVTFSDPSTGYCKKRPYGLWLCGLMALGFFYCFFL